jgi:hypothetical protein
MENNETKIGTWDNMDTGERKPKVEFELNKPEIVTIECEEPREIPWEDSAFYVFDVTHNGEDKCISTSAWTLMRGLKAISPRKGKTLTIVKELLNGRQSYKVTEGAVIPEEKVE